MKKLKFDNEKLILKIGSYESNGKLAILAFTSEEPYADITINLPGFYLKRNEGFIDSITKDCGLEQKLLEEGIIEKIVKKVKYNFQEYDLAVFNMDKLNEYDSVGMSEYKKRLENEEELE